MPSKPRKRRRCPIDVFRYQDYRAFLAAYYEHEKPRGFSYRAFASAAGLGAPNYLQLVIQGRRNLTHDMARRFAQTCGLGQDTADYFVTLVAFNQATDNEERNQQYQKLSGFRRYRRAQMLELREAADHSHGYLPAIRELALSASFRECLDLGATLRWADRDGKPGKSASFFERWTRFVNELDGSYTNHLSKRREGPPPGSQGTSLGLDEPRSCAQ